MKLLTAFFALVALTLATSAFAQEESPSPSSEEKASTTIETTPEATTAPATAEEKPAATTSPAKEKASPAATGAKKEAAATSETKKTTAAPAAKSGAKMSPEATIRDNENRWEAAIGSHDASTVGSMVASDFMGVSSKGKFINKSGLLSEMKGNKDTYKSAKNDKLNVRAYDKDVIVVSGSSREKGTGKDGKAFDRTYLFTDTWVQRNGQWQCVASQVSLRK